jgi:hypothetical protein
MARRPAVERPPDPTPVRSKARLRRMAVLLVWWAVALIGLFWLVIGGPLLILLPVGLVAVLVVANTIVIVRRTGPEETALEAGRLEEADRSRGDGVAVWATRSPRARSERGRRSGTLAYGGRRLSFTVDALPDGKADDDPLGGLAVLDAPVDEVELGRRPSLMRPALVVAHGGTTHVLDLSPGFDLGAGAVGAVVTQAWWDQLAERGARATMAP